MLKYCSYDCEGGTLIGDMDVTKFGTKFDRICLKVLREVIS